MKEEIYNKDNFYNYLWLSDGRCLWYDRCLKAEHLKPVDDFLLEGKSLTAFSDVLYIYQETRKCVLDFDIYTLEECYRKGNTGAAELMIDCYHYAAKNGVTEAYNNIGVFFAMTDRLEEALPYWKKGALGGSALAWVNLANYFNSNENNDDVLFCLTKLKELNHPMGYWNWALSYHFGFLGITPDAEKAKGLYREMMSLLPRDEKEKAEGGSKELLDLKTMACYNLAKMRFMIEEHTKENLDSIVHLLTRTPYVLLDQPRSNQLIDEIKHIIFGNEQRVRC